MVLVLGFWTFLRAVFFGSAAVALEKVALRHQLLVLQRSVGRPRLARWDRVFWVWLSRVWVSWRSSLVIVRPATVLAWHRQGFRLYWQWKSRAKPVGRPRLDHELRQLIRRMARENPTWGRRRIRAELTLLGYEVAELTVAKYMRRTALRPSPTWRTFLDTHLRDLVAIDFFLVSTLTFRLLFVVVVLRHDRREILHLNVTDHPTAVWTLRQLTQAFPEDTAPNYLLRDRDGIYGQEFSRGVERMGIREVCITPRSPWQTPSWSGSSGPFAASAWITPSFSMMRTFAGSCVPTSPTTTARARIKRWRTTAPSLEPSSRPHAAGSAPFPRSAGFITATSASPDRGRARPRRARSRSPPEGRASLCR
jgi:putative transposase